MQEVACDSYNEYSAFYPPKCNCVPCWYKYFNENLGVAIAVDAIERNYGERGLEGYYGSKYIKFYRRWKNDRTGSAVNAGTEG